MLVRPQLLPSVRRRIEARSRKPLEQQLVAAGKAYHVPRCHRSRPWGVGPGMVDAPRLAEHLVRPADATRGGGACVLQEGALAALVAVGRSAVALLAIVVAVGHMGIVALGDWSQTAA